MIRFLIILLMVSGNMPQASAQRGRHAPFTTTTEDSLTRLIIVVNERTGVRDTVLFEKDTGSYTPQLSPSSGHPQPVIKDAGGIIQYYDLPYQPPRLTIRIKLVNSVIRDISELKFYATINNNASYPQRFLFDRPRQPDFVLWGASCRIKGSHAPNVLQLEGNPRFLTRAADKEILARNQFTLKGNEWLMKQYSAADFVVLNKKVCKNGKLPPGTYTLQFIFQQNYSNEVTFTVR